MQKYKMSNVEARSVVLFDFIKKMSNDIRIFSISIRILVSIKHLIVI